MNLVSCLSYNEYWLSSVYDSYSIVIVILAELVSSPLRYFMFFPMKAEKIGSDEPHASGKTRIPD